MIKKWDYLYKVSTAGWSKGLPETACGSGSTLRYNDKLINRLNEIIQKYSIKSIVDLGCGDFNWMSQVNLDGVDYKGYDWILRFEYIEKGYDNIQFFEANIGEMDIPQADLIICKDVFIHMKNEHIFQVLNRIAFSESKYLLTSTYAIENNDRVLNNYAPLDIEQDPFNINNRIETIHMTGNNFCNLYKL